MHGIQLPSAVLLLALQVLAKPSHHRVRSPPPCFKLKKKEVDFLSLTFIVWGQRFLLPRLGAARHLCLESLRQPQLWGTFQHRRSRSKSSSRTLHCPRRRRSNRSTSRFSFEEAVRVAIKSGGSSCSKWSSTSNNASSNRMTGTLSRLQYCKAAAAQRGKVPVGPLAVIAVATARRVSRVAPAESQRSAGNVVARQKQQQQQQALC